MAVSCLSWVESRFVASRSPLTVVVVVAGEEREGRDIWKKVKGIHESMSLLHRSTAPFIFKSTNQLMYDKLNAFFRESKRKYLMHNFTENAKNSG